MRKNHRRSRSYRKKRRLILKALIYGGLFLLIIIGSITVIYKIFVGLGKSASVDVDASQPGIDVQLLDVNEYSRPGIEIDEISGIVIHYTANPGSTAKENRDYFNSLQDGHGTSVSSHFVIGLEGEIVQCIPTWEVAYASNERNNDTISIECCHKDESGKFTDETYSSLIQLTAYLCDKYDLDEKDVIRHYDVTGKICPKYFVDNEKAWNQLKIDVKAALERGNKEE